MSVARPSQCLICSFSRSVGRASPARRKFHSSLPHFRRKSKHHNVKVQDMPGATSANNLPQIKQKDQDEATEDLPGLRSYVESSRSALKEQLEAARKSGKYTSEQIRAIEAADTAVTPEQLARVAPRADPWSLDYLDDLTEIHPVVDKPVRKPHTHTDPNLRLKNEDEIDEDLAKFVQNFPDDPAEQEKAFANFDRNFRLTVGREEAERSPRTALGPELGSLEDPDSVVVKPNKKRGDAGSGSQSEEAASTALVRLMQMTGFTRQQIAGLRVKSVVSHRVVNQTRLGKISKMYFLSIAGNGQGLIGIGEGKSEEPSEARLQSQYRAIRNMQPILRYENRTIFGDVKGKVSATELELYTRPPGFGLRCQQYIWEICKCAGISDLAARVTRSRNPMNTVKATVQALLSQKDPEEIAKARGKKMVDVRKVYYAGAV